MKSKWDDIKDKLILVQGWARDGLTDEQIATNLGIGKTALYKYKKKYAEFAKALKKGKEVVDREVENALLKRALGYTYEEITTERVLNKDTGEYEEVITKRVTKEVQPDVTAQIFWLKNRKRLEWRDKQEIQADIGNAGEPFKITIEEV